MSETATTSIPALHPESLTYSAPPNATREDRQALYQLRLEHGLADEIERVRTSEPLPDYTATVRGYICVTEDGCPLGTGTTPQEAHRNAIDHLMGELADPAEVITVWVRPDEVPTPRARLDELPRAVIEVRSDDEDALSSFLSHVGRDVAEMELEELQPPAPPTPPTPAEVSEFQHERVCSLVGLLFSASRHPEIAARILASLPYDVRLMLDVITLERQEQEERRAAAPVASQRPPRVVSPQDTRWQSEEHRRQVWREYLERWQPTIDAMRASTAPVELPRGATRWAAVNPEGMVLGAAETIEEAHKLGVEDALRLVSDFEYLIACCDFPPGYGDDNDGEEYLLGSELAGYVRIQGPAELVEQVIRKGRIIG